MFAYVVKGSEDGNLSVFRSKKKAIQAAKDYVTNSAESAGTEFDISEFCNGDIVTVSAEWGWVTADIEKFVMA